MFKGLTSLFRTALVLLLHWLASIRLDVAANWITTSGTSDCIEQEGYARGDVLKYRACTSKPEKGGDKQATGLLKL